MEDGLTPAKPEEKVPDLASLKRMAEEASTLTSTARIEQQKDQDYYDGYQWTPAEKDTLALRKQPANSFNLIALTVNGTVGVIDKGATDPRAYPRNPKDEDAADVASKTLRFIADANRFDSVKLDCALDYLVPGTMAAIVEVNEDRQITVTQIRHEEFIYDPRSRKKDFSDARFMGIAKWQWADDVAARYPDKKGEVENAIESGGALGLMDSTMDDRPSDGQTSVAWVDKKKRRVMVVELYHLDGGEWQRCVFFSGALLEYGPSPYKDEKGRPTNPIEARSCFVDRENNRYGLVRNMRPAQDEINKRHSKTLHELNSRQVRQTDASAMVTDLDVIRKEAARPDGVLPWGWDVIPRSDIISGQVAMLQEAKGFLERMGPAPEVLGRQGADSSGRAQLVRQQAGLTELAIVFGGLEDWELRIYRQKWARARQYWDAAMWIRTTDDEGAPQFTGINQPQIAQDPMTGQPVQVGVQNAVAELDVDIILDSVPDTVNVQQEQFAQLVELAKMYGPQEVPFDDLLELSTMPNKRALMEKRKGRAEQMNQMQGMQQELQARAAQADLAEKEAKASKTAAEADLTGAKAVTEKLMGAANVAQAMTPQPQGPPPGL